MKTCKCGCGSDMSDKHANAKFINKKHKDKYHNSQPDRLGRTKQFTKPKIIIVNKTVSELEKLLDDKINHPFADMTEYGDRG